ncbi:two-component system, NarL family, response regulator LiaR [Salinibacillus kushneri]|uniref:Two-component system, NarL family, response regulator LiaR n=1 Tax=Salinibacillus kushneri TaxID=237682 RepID=A0A1I0AZV9_9BACI|nr:response regulator transcription factor [Salinibacillus kushneri]SES99571.1 two-component system, NarL family, response regulator LiaR [Salinibacillus kushneri]
MENQIKVLVVDDHEVVRKGISTYLMTEDGIEVAGEATSGEEGCELARKEQPDVILMDLIMKDGNGIEATKKIMSFLPQSKIIILTSYYDDEKVFPALEAGAFSYMLKTSSADEIVEAIKKAVRGENVIESKVASKMMNRFRQQQQLPHLELTERELEVLICIGNGLTNQEISEKLYIGIKTVKTHVSNILSKLDVQGRTQAAVYAHRNGLMVDS